MPGPKKGQRSSQGSSQPPKQQQQQKKRRVKAIGAGKAFALGLLSAILMGIAIIVIMFLMSIKTANDNNAAIEAAKQELRTYTNDTATNFGVTAGVKVRENVALSAANVSATSEATDSQGGQHVENGAGVVYQITDSTAYILTCYHVIDKATSISVSIRGASYVATPVGEGDPSSDLAVLKIEGLSQNQLKTMQTANRGDSSDVRQGDWCMLVGNPHGFNDSMSVGTVSAVGRNIPKSLYTGDVLYANMLQTDAALNPGNSGGGMWDAHGDLIGIASLIWSMDGGNEGIGFAIPINYAAGIADDLIAGNAPAHASLGVELDTVPDSEVSSYGLLSNNGAYVNYVVRSGPAELSGIAVGDIITQIDGVTIKNVDDVKLLVRGKTIGQEINVVYMRQGSEMTRSLKLGSDANMQ